ncbi:MAG: Ca-activated chloride channel family protein, partial [Francisella sp.]
MSLRKLILSIVLLPCISQASSWSDAWQTKDQQGVSSFEAGDYKASAQAFKNYDWKGTAHYKAKEYDNAYDEFKKDSSATGLYNQGNALTQLGKYDDAIGAYNEAIEKRPDFEDAKSNLEIVKELEKQKDQNQQDNK